jgi:16S rRNA (cytosine967-C5)-methyltransferase
LNRKRGNMPNAREMAYDITRRVNCEGGYLGLLLRYGLDRAGLDPRDRSLVTELAYGVQRHRGRLDHIIASFSNRPLEELDPEVLDILRLGIYQLTQMRVPPHAAVSETVALGKKKLGEKAGSFINAVMRAASDGPDKVEWPSRDDLPAFLETTYSHPRWLVEYMLCLWGPEKAEAICAADNTISPLTLRANVTRMDAPSLLGEIEAAGGKATLSAYIEEAVTDVVLPRERLLELLEQGLCVAQDESSILVGRCADPGPGDIIIDACAAPGGKATHLALLGGESCRVIAVDVNTRRLRALRNSAGRQGLPNIEIIEWDSTHLAERYSNHADVILVDAPCSGLGTLRRNPELRWRRAPGDAARLARLQLDLLEGCAGALKPGGTLVYSVCTYTSEETSDVIERFLGAHEEFSREDLAPLIPASLGDAVTKEGHVQLMVYPHDMESMFITRLSKS